MKLGDKLEKLAESTRITRPRLREILEEAGLKVSNETLRSYFINRTVPDLTMAKAIAKVYGVSVNYLADDELDEPPEEGLTEAERELLEAYRESGIPQRKVIAWLASGGAQPEPRLIPPPARPKLSEDAG